MESPILERVAWPLRTARLVLRPAQPADADATFAYRSLPQVGQWLSRIQTDRVWWQELWETNLEQKLIVERDGAVIGDTRLAAGDGSHQSEVEQLARNTEAELMWAFAPAGQGSGYATEAVRAMVDIAFSELGLRRLIARCYADNEPSWRLMERLGMWREAHHIRSSLHRDGTWRDMFIYALLNPAED